MPFQIIREPRGIYKKFSGHVCKEEFLQSVFQTQNDPDFDRLTYSLVDYLAVTSHDVENLQVDTAAAFALGAEFVNPRIKIIVVTTDPAIRNLVMRFTAISNYPLGLFTTLEEARQWLELAA